MAKDKDSITEPVNIGTQQKKMKTNTSLTVGGQVHAVKDGVAQDRPVSKKIALAELSGLVQDLEARIEMLEAKVK